MDVLDVLRVCLRRWYVVLPFIILALGAGFGLARQQKPSYTAFASYALVFHDPDTSSSSERSPLEQNPLGATLLGEALVGDLMSGPSQRAFGGAGNRGTAPGQPSDKNASYSVSRPQDASGQRFESYQVQTWGEDPVGVRRVVDSVVAAAPARAAAIQDRADAPRRSRYTVFVTSSTEVAELPPPSKVKFVVAVLGLGILSGSALSLIVDRILRSRRVKRSAKLPPDASQPAEDIKLTNNPDTSSSNSGVLQIPATSSKPPSMTGEVANNVTESSGGAAPSSTRGAPVAPYMPPAELELQAVMAPERGGDRNDDSWGQSTVMPGNTYGVNGTGRTSERTVETWSVPPWVSGAALEEVIVSDKGVEVHTQATMRAISSSTVGDSRWRDQQPSQGERPDEVHGKPGQGRTVEPADMDNGTERISEAHGAKRQYV